MPVIPICILFAATWKTAQTLAEIEGPFDYIVIADTIGMFRRYRWHAKAGASLSVPRRRRIIISYYSHLWEPVAEARRSAASAQQAAENQLHRHRRIS